jgi:hypothetical protein
VYSLVSITDCGSDEYEVVLGCLCPSSGAGPVIQEHLAALKFANDGCDTVE